jgi:hypothetical protein
MKTVRIAASSVIDNPTLSLLLLVSDTHNFYLPLEMTSCQGLLRCEQRESSHQLHGFRRCVLDRKFGMPEGPESKLEEIIYLYMLLHMHTKSQLNPLNFVIPLV